ncbi:hypothetical protein VC83_07500 [Pseudogymnoascus destructans]|uniref:FCP1 homology domain-containing protein n=2 Tax=Pseudogymnoascus destructans TaxID=655981 RepID=L8G1A3_PSED2|nr:uncharacterized protein VC83_07500 [Pseudogymnoascus destructans]ELR06559.1 hypothetical protein GMDG_02193 [Pseudogymnoascus destructans 20631-21]OAF56197.2 hypothetical protein VC83_07500 [Pseudogymnoascus destructans]
MSNEVAQPVEHESVRSSTVEQKNGYTSKASTTPNHFADSQRDQTSNEPDLTSVPVGDESSVTTSDTLKRNHTLLHVLSRSSSHKIQPSPTATALSGATASDPTSSIGGGSRKSNSSIIGEKRNGSLSSSKRSTPAAAESTPATVNATSSQSAQMQKPKKSRGFLSFLNCCGVPDSANGIDPEEPALPVKPTTSTTSQARVTTPSKPVSSVPDVTTSHKSAQQPEKAAMVPNTTPGDDRPSVEGTGVKQSQTVAEQHANSKDSRNQPLPAIPRDAEEPVADTNALGASNPVVFVQAPTPIIPQQDRSIPILSQNATNNEVDTKVHMGDSGEGNTTKDVEGNQQTNTADITLPPPPAIAGAGTNSDALSQTQGPSVVDTVEEKQQWLLPPIEPRFNGKKCLVLDLDETLVHSSFKILHQADFTIPVEIEGQYHNVYVIKRPGVDQFMKRVGELYEVVVFTASVSKYGDPLLDQLDIHNVVHHRLFRESCYNHQGNYVKDLSQVGRDLRETIIIDNSPTSYIFHPQHAVPISSWFSDAHDNELLDLIPVLEDLAGSQVRDVSLVLDVAL